MLFNSLIFIYGYLPVVVAVFFLLGKVSQQLGSLWLCAASLFFYGWWNVNYVPLLLASVAFNYCAGYLIGRAGPSRSFPILAVAVMGDLALLGYYKYAMFFTDSVDRFAGLHLSIGEIILPLGISFFTFTQIAFLVDVHRQKAKEYNFVHYLLFVTYFPHLIAGPILHHAQMMPQFAQRTTYHVNWRNFATGVTIFIIGLGKKVLLADTFSLYTQPIFMAVSNGASPMLIEAWVAALSYTLQLYFDFSGYTDMAIGISYIFNIKLPLNFNSPYKARNIVDFWRRWHMTLSAFLRDYLYISLGGNRHGNFRRYLNLMLTMLLGGLWHGAGWTFVIWGGLHGLYLIINHAFSAFRESIGWKYGRFGLPGAILSTGVTFLSVVVAWVFFRADSFGSALRILEGMSGHFGVSLPVEWKDGHLASLLPFLQAHGVIFNGYMPLTFPIAFLSNNSMPKIALGLFIIWAMPNTQEWMGILDATKESPAPTGWRALLNWQPERWWTWTTASAVLALCLLLLASGGPSEFLYFQF